MSNAWNLKTMVNLPIGNLSTSKYTKVRCESPMEQQFNAPHYFEVTNSETEELLQAIHFQEGPIKENGVNGVANEDLINMVITRLDGFQNSPFRCAENEQAKRCLIEALGWLRSRTLQREARGVEGTNVV